MCVCGLQEIVNKLDRVLVLDTSSQLLSYDTTFKLGDFYVSPLIFRHTLFKETPCIPAMFLIHERKFAEMHQEMFRECAKRIPSLRKVNCPLVTDKESAIVNAINSELPAVAVLHCWNHIFRDIRLWCRKHGHLRQTSQSTLRTYSSCFIHRRRRSMKRSYAKGNTHGMQHLKPTTCKRFTLMCPSRLGGGSLKSITNTTHTAG